jgi:hypothetical protein
MALSGTRMGDAVVAALEGVDGSMTPAQKAQLTTAWEAICKAIVTEITTNGTVPSPIAVAVSTGTGIGATTAPGTIL